MTTKPMDKPHNNIPVVPAKDFSDMFDKDGEVITDTPPDTTPPPAPIPTNIIQNTNQQTGAEFTVFFKNPQGFKGHLKLHGVSGRDVLETAAGALAYLAANDFVPEYGTAAAPTQVTRENLPTDGSASETWCDIHKCSMKRREKDNQVWYSHKIEGTDDWCRGPK